MGEDAFYLLPVPSYLLFAPSEKTPPHLFDAGAQWLTRYHPDSRAFGRAFIPACIGTARRGLNVLAPACSGAMFPGLPDAAFHLPRLSWDGPNRVLSPSSHAILILLIYSPFVKGLSSIVHNRRRKERFGLIFQRKGDILKTDVKEA